jgi:spermidine/putrescine transport system permease protein
MAWLRRNGVKIFGGLVIAYMLIPIAVISLFSYNDHYGKFNFTWSGFTTDHWSSAFSIPELNDALLTSLELAAVSTLIATILGTMIEMALVRHQFHGRKAANLLIVIPMTSPEVVIGAALLSMFVYAQVTTGFVTLLIAHVMFTISFVVVVVRSRLIGFDRHLEEAAMDLGANPFSTFGRVTLPLIAPGIAAGGLLAFALSIDDFVITLFNAGPTITFPLYVWGAARVGVPPQVNVIGTLIFLLAAGLMIVNVLTQIRRSKGAT